MFDRSRRAVLHAGLAAGAYAALQPFSSVAADLQSLPLITRAIPSSGEQLPVVGIGTNQFDVTAPEDIAARRDVLQAMPQLGGRLLDTARGYGRSEEVIGTLLAQLKNRDRFFIATKPVSAPQADATRAICWMSRSASSARIASICSRCTASCGSTSCCRSSRTTNARGRSDTSASRLRYRERTKSS